MTCSFRNLKNTPPVAAADVARAAPAGATQLARLLDNDSDANGDELSIVDHTTPAGGTLSCTGGLLHV